MMHNRIGNNKEHNDLTDKGGDLLKDGKKIELR